MGGGKPIWFAVLGNAAVAAIPFAALGWNALAAHAAVRSTARFSSAWFVAGLASPALARRLRVWPREPRLMQAFLAAQLVHFATVALVWTTFDRGRVAQNPLRTALVVAFGFGLTLTAGLTAGRWTSGPGAVVHRVALYSLFLIFLAAYSHHPNRRLRLLVVPLALALPLRLSASSALGAPQARCR